MADGVPTVAKAGGDLPSRLVRSYYRSRKLQNRLYRLMESVFTGAWLAILSPGDLNSIDDTYYVGVGGAGTSPIDYANPEYNRRGLFEWEQRMVTQHFRPGSLIGLMAAGGGREVLALRRHGFRVAAWECQPELVDAANDLLVAEGFEPSVIFAPRNSIPSEPVRCDAVIIGWGTYTLIPGRHRRIAVLRELRSKVTSGSPLLLSFFTRGRGGVQFRIIAGVGNIGRRLLRREPLEVGDSLEPNFVRLFVESEITDELAAAGFELRHFDRRPYGHAVAVATGPDS